MGLTITSYPLHNGLVNVSNVYAYVRDMRTTKEPNDNFSLNYLFFLEKTVDGVTTRLETKGYYDTSTTVYNDLWLASYTHLKTQLDLLGVTYVDA